MSDNEELVKGAAMDDNGDVILRLRSTDDAKMSTRRAALQYAASRIRKAHPLAALDLMLIAEDMRTDGQNRHDDTQVVVLQTRTD